jgi:hypothetical protein
MNSREHAARKRVPKNEEVLYMPTTTARPSTRSLLLKLIALG